MWDAEAAWGFYILKLDRWGIWSWEFEDLDSSRKTRSILYCWTLAQERGTSGSLYVTVSCSEADARANVCCSRMVVEDIWCWRLELAAWVCGTQCDTQGLLMNEAWVLLDI